MKVEDKYSLDLFMDEEISAVCRIADLDLFLDPIKDKRYSKYTKTLGRLDKRTVLVQKLLPGIAFSLYKKGEDPFRKAIAIQLNNLRRMFTDIIGEWNDPTVTLENIRNYDIKEMATLYYKLSEDMKIEISPELFFVLLKLQDIDIEDEKCREITSQIETIKIIRDIKKKHIVELEESLKQQAKQMHAEFEQEKKELKRHQEEIQKAYKQEKENLEVAEQRISRFENTLETEKEQYRQEWLLEYEKELDQRKKQDEDKRDQDLQDARTNYQELLMQLENAFETKKTEKEKEYQRYVSTKKEHFDEMVREADAHFSELQTKRTIIENQLEDAKKKLTEEEKKIADLESREAEYFDSFEKRILFKKIDSLLFERLGMNGNTSEKKSEEMVALSNSSDFVITEAKSFSEDTEYGSDVASLEDFFEDIKCNIAMNFDDETDIAATVLSGVINRQGIIAVDSVCNCIAQALSALLDLGKPFEVNVSTGCSGLKSIVEAINGSKSQVVCIKGVLDNYDETMFRCLGELCYGKYLFFSISNIENVSMMSKSIMNYGIVVDAEDKLHFTTDEMILINDHDFEEMLPKFDLKKNREIFKKNFGRLVTNCLIKKSAALRYCFLVQMYNELTNTATMGEIIQKVIINACNLEDADDGTEDVMHKCGLTVWSM